MGHTRKWDSNGVKWTLGLGDSTVHLRRIEPSNPSPTRIDKERIESLQHHILASPLSLTLRTSPLHPRYALSSLSNSSRLSSPRHLTGHSLEIRRRHEFTGADEMGRGEFDCYLT
jgi:hypothetical protein